MPISIPDFPQKHIFSLHNEKFLYNRQLELDRWLQGVLMLVTSHSKLKPFVLAFLQDQLTLMDPRVQRAVTSINEVIAACSDLPDEQISCVLARCNALAATVSQKFPKSPNKSRKPMSTGFLGSVSHAAKNAARRKSSPDLSEIYVPPTINQALSTPIICEAFIKACKSERKAESPLFLVAVDSYRRTFTKTAGPVPISAATLIVNQFIEIPGQSHPSWTKPLPSKSAAMVESAVTPSLMSQFAKLPVCKFAKICLPQRIRDKLLKRHSDAVAAGAPADLKLFDDAASLVRKELILDDFPRFASSLDCMALWEECQGTTRIKIPPSLTHAKSLF